MISAILALVVGVLCIPVLVLAIEVSCGVLLTPAAASLPATRTRPRLAVLVPAHNESAGLLPTLANIQSQLLPEDRLLVVADNCTDDTARIATAAPICKQTGV